MGSWPDLSKNHQILTIREGKNDVSEQLSKLDFLEAYWVYLRHWLSHDPQARFATGPAQRLGLLRAQASSKRQNLNESLLVGPKQAHSVLMNVWVYLSHWLSQFLYINYWLSQLAILT